MVQWLWKTVRSFLKKLKTELPHDLAIPLPGIYLIELKARAGRDAYTLLFIRVLFTIAISCAAPNLSLLQVNSLNSLQIRFLKRTIFCFNLHLLTSD